MESTTVDVWHPSKCGQMSAVVLGVRRGCQSPWVWVLGSEGGSPQEQNGL